MQSWCPLPRTYEGRPRRGRAAYTAVYGARLSSVRVRVLQPVLHSSREGWRVASHFRSASVEPFSQQTEVQDAHR